MHNRIKTKNRYTVDQMVISGHFQWFPQFSTNFHMISVHILFLLVTFGKQHTQFEVNILVQYKVKDPGKKRFHINIRLSQPSWIWWLWRKNNLILINCSLYIFFQFHLDPLSGSWVITGEKMLQTDRPTDGWTGQKHIICLQPDGQRHNN